MSEETAEADARALRVNYETVMDHAAAEALRARIAELEARRDRMKQVNAEIRRGEGWPGRLAVPLTPDEINDLKSAARFSGCVGYPAYALSNLSGNLKRQRDRLAQLTGTYDLTPKRGPAAELVAYEAAQAKQERAEVTP